MTKKKRRKRKLTYPREKTNPASMGGGGPGKPTLVINGEMLMKYVGIGWVESRKATKADRKKYPTLVDA